MKAVSRKPVEYRRVNYWVAAIASAILVSASSAMAGDAVAVGYNASGMWVAVTYYCSGTAKGGRDYKDSSAAREAALRDLRRRSADGIARAEVIESSDRTGHFAVARAKSAAGKESIVVGSGDSPAAAEQSAIDKLHRTGATGTPTVMYRYFSNGSDSAAAH